MDAPVWWQQPDNQELARSLAWPLGMVAMGLVVLLGMVRPGLKLMKAAPATSKAADAQPALSAVLNEAPDRPGLPMPANHTHETLRLEDAKRLAKENPIAVANIVKTWVNGEAPA